MTKPNGVTIEGIRAAVKAKWPRAYAYQWGGPAEMEDGWTIYKETSVMKDNRFGSGGSEDAAWSDAFSRLCPAEKSLAVACPFCLAPIGMPCLNRDMEPVAPGEERIAAVTEEDIVWTTCANCEASPCLPSCKYAAPREEVGKIKDLLFDDNLEFMLKGSSINNFIREAEWRGYQRGRSEVGNGR